MPTERMLQADRERARQLVEKQVCKCCGEEKLLRAFVCRSLSRKKYDLICLECRDNKTLLQKLKKISKYFNTSETIDPTSCNLISMCTECKKLMHDRATEVNLARPLRFAHVCRRARIATYGKPPVCTECAENLTKFCGITKCDWCGRLKNSRYVFDTSVWSLEPIAKDVDGKRTSDFTYNEYMQFTNQLPKKICIGCNNKFMAILKKEAACGEIDSLIRAITREIGHARKIANNG